MSLIAAAIYTLMDAVVSLYPEGDDGTHPLWFQVKAEQLRFAPKQIVIETRPSGAVTPRRHVLPVTTWDITLGRIWAVELGVAYAQIDTQPATDRYTLVVIFSTKGQMESPGQTWTTHTYSGVTFEGGDTADQAKCDFLTSYSFAAEGRVKDFTAPSGDPLYQDDGKSWVHHAQQGGGGGNLFGLFLTLAELRADVSLYDRKVAVMAGLLTPDDGLGHTYRYDASSVLDDNPPLVVRPTVNDADPGAYLALS